MFDLDVTVDGNTVSVEVDSIEEAAEITSDFVEYIMDCDSDNATITVHPQE